MATTVRIGMDTAKNVFQLHGLDGDEIVVLNRQLRRDEMISRMGSTVVLPLITAT